MFFGVKFSVKYKYSGIVRVQGVWQNQWDWNSRTLYIINEGRWRREVNYNSKCHLWKRTNFIKEEVRFYWKEGRRSHVGQRRREEVEFMCIWRSEERKYLRVRKDLMEQHWTQKEVKCLLQIQQFRMNKYQGEKLTLEDPSLHSCELQRKRHF